MNMRQDRVLWIALGIPVLMILAVAATIYIPRLNVKPPTTNFVYALASNDPYGPGYYYAVRDGKLVQEKTPEPPKNYPKTVPLGVSSTTHLYLHDVAANTSREISFQEAQNFRLDSSLDSPDGFEIQQGSGGGVFPFFIENNNYNTRYLVHGTWSETLQLKGVDQNSYYGWQFLGWVIPK